MPNSTTEYTKVSRKRIEPIQAGRPDAARTLRGWSARAATGAPVPVPGAAVFARAGGPPGPPTGSDPGDVGGCGVGSVTAQASPPSGEPGTAVSSNR
jgi:hypothetical protein